MSDAPAPAPAPTPAPAAAPAPTPAPAPAPAAAVERPAYIPEQFWDAEAKAVKADDFGKHYGEIAANAAKYAERAAAVPEKPEGYKVELKLPDDVKLPDGVKLDPAKDPRLPMLLQVAHKRGWSNDDVNELVALDAQLAISAVNAQATRVLAEDKKLGEKAIERRAAVANWLKGQKDFTADEIGMVNAETLDAAGITLIEKLMAKVNGSIPGHVPTPPPQPAPKTHADRIWPSGFSSTPQAKVG